VPTNCISEGLDITSGQANGPRPKAMIFDRPDNIRGGFVLPNALIFIRSAKIGAYWQVEYEVSDRITPDKPTEVIMPTQNERTTVTQEWLDWYRDTWYQNGVNDERIRQLTERLEAESSQTRQAKSA
jgi:hypothetical protein